MRCSIQINNGRFTISGNAGEIAKVCTAIVGHCRGEMPSAIHVRRLISNGGNVSVDTKDASGVACISCAGAKGGEVQSSTDINGERSGVVRTDRSDPGPVGSVERGERQGDNEVVDVGGAALDVSSVRRELQCGGDSGVGVGLTKRQKKNALKKKKKELGVVVDSGNSLNADSAGVIQDEFVDLKKNDVVASASSVPEWRVSASAIGTDQASEGKTKAVPVEKASNFGRRQGFFSDCDEKVQRELRESRAQLLILENRRKAKEQERRIAQMDSPMQLLQDAMKMMDFAGKIAKKQNDTKVQGWAKTVATSYAENIVKSVSSPNSGSYESYVWSKASSDESRDSTPALTKGLANFNIELEQLKERYAGMPFYSQDDYDLDMMELKDKYAEALFEPLPAKLIRENNIKREQLFDIFKDEVLRLPHLELLERERAEIFEEYGV